ncbi:MAG: hypothetical protein FWB93_04250 [Oscillospiraceae bacterium]|nr:hypothetical protein [Oscillospiraceae bacterium]
MSIVQNYDDFVARLLQAGFSMGGGNDDGIFAVVNWGWNAIPPAETKVAWHTENPELDPWEWRVRVLVEREDIAYAKLFFGKSGFITKEWYTNFLAARRDGVAFEDAYDDGTISHTAKRIYDVVIEYGVLPVHDIKVLGGFPKEKEFKSQFDKALTELQMKMYLTMCSTERKCSRKGLEHGWPSTVFCTVDSFFGEEVIQQAAKLGQTQAADAIRKQILRLNPNANDKKIKKFIFG